MELIIVTGLSGGGKTQALRCLEDMGYFCVDNLPCAMVGGFVQLCRDSKPPVEKAAVVVDSRESVFERELQQAHKQLNNLPISFHILYLECRDDVLERRYNESRRPHPLNSDIRAGIQAERELLSFFRDRAEYIIDTSDLKPMELRRKLEEYFGFPEKNDFQLIIESFGYKRGVPLEADMVFDMRFSANPFYEEKLRSLSGQDKPVREFIEKDETYISFVLQTESMLKQLIPAFIKQGKRRLLVCFGCTGGRHRSVCAAEEMYRRMKGSYSTRLLHRDAGIEARDIEERTGGRDER